MKFIYALCLFICLCSPVLAIEPHEILQDKVQEMRARKISQEIRCLVCQGESIDESQADFAKDIRLLIRQRILAGESDVQVFEFLRERYGDYIFLKPPFAKRTWILWLMPFLFLIVGFFVIKPFMRIEQKD